MTRGLGASRPSVALLLAVLVVATACASTTPTETAGSASAAASDGAAPISGHTRPVGATAPVDDAAWRLADRLHAAVFSADSTAALVDALARSGIATQLDAATPSAEAPLPVPASPFRLLDFQVHDLAVGVWAGAGYTGEELDAIVPLPDGLPGQAPTSALLAAYVAAADSPGGAVSRALMAREDLLHPSTARFPAVVLVLFVSDLATDGGRVAAPGASPSPAADVTRLLALAPTRAGTVEPALAIGSVCSDTANWIKGMLASLFDALKLATPDNVPGAIVASIWNWLVDVAHALVNSLITSITDVVLGTIRSIAASIAAVAEQVASILPYVVKVSASGDAGSPPFKLGPNPLRGTFTAQVSVGDLPAWPAVLDDCAKTAQVDLPDLQAKQAPLTWGPLAPATDPLLAPVDSATTEALTDDHGRATWGFLTSRDPGDPKGREIHQIDHMAVAVHRPELDQARQKLTTALLGFIPSLVRPFVTALFKPYLDGLQARLNALLDARGTGAAELVFHDVPAPTPVPSTTPAPSSVCGSLAIPAGHYTGTFTLDSVTTVPPFTPGESGVTTDHGTGPLALVVASDGTASGSFVETTTSEGVFSGVGAGESVTTYTVTGSTIGGSVCQLVLTFGTATITACRATGFASCGGGSTSLGDISLPMGAPTAAGGSLTWTRTDDTAEHDQGPLDVSVRVVSTETVTVAPGG